MQIKSNQTELCAMLQDYFKNYENTDATVTPIIKDNYDVNARNSFTVDFRVVR